MNETIAELQSEIKNLRKRVVELEKIEKLWKQAKAEQQRNEEIWHTLYENLPGGSFIVNKSYIIEEVNDFLCELTNYSREELIGKKCDILCSDAPYKCPIIISGKGKIENEETAIKTKDNKYIPIIKRARNFFINGREIIVENFQDISALKQAQQELIESEMRYRSVVEDQTELICRFKPDGTLTFVNNVYCQFFGKKPEELIGKDSMMLIYEQDREKVRKKFSSISFDKPVVSYEQRVISATGEIRFLQWRDRAIFNDKKEVIEYQGVGRDISSQKQAELKLLESEERYRNLVEMSPVAIIVHHAGKVMYSNNAANKLLEVEKEKILNSSVYDFLHPDYHDIVRERIKKSQQEGQLAEALEEKFITYTGKVIDVEVVGIPATYKGKKATLAVCWDITKRKRAEQLQTVLFNISQATSITRNLKELLQFIYQQLGTLIDTSNFFVALYDRTKDSYTFPFYVDEYDKLEDFSPRQLRKSLTDYVRRSATPLLVNQQKFKELADKGEVELVGTRASIWLGAPLKIARGVIGVVALQSYKYSSLYTEKDLELLTFVSENIAMAIERKRTEDRLRRERDFAESLIKTAPIIVMVLNVKGRIIRFNPYMEYISGYKLEEVKGKDWVSTFFPETEQQRVKDSFLKEVSGTAVDRNIYPIITRDGKKREIEWYNKTLKNEKGDIVGLLVIGQDISERRKLEQEQQKAAKLESIGILAGGIAHDFNNLLTAIIGNISLARTELDSDDEVYDMLLDAEKASLRAQDLTQQLLTFSRGGLPIKKLISITDLLKDSVRFALRGSNVRCQFKISEDLWSVEIDSGLINQVINNIIINADQAMPEGGVIELIAENVEINDAWLLPLKPGNYIKITIKDQGIGISEEHLPKVFDPYFSTKQKGSGLGLATSYSIIKNHNGYIGVESKLGVGSSFYIYLPAYIGSKPARNKIKQRSTRGKGRILVMDDEEIIIKTVKKILARSGYEVESAKEGREVIKKYQHAMKNNQKFDVVIMDLTIPGGMGGKETIKKLYSIDPEVKAIASSGYSNDPILANYADYKFCGFLSKPYRSEELKNVLAEVMELPKCG